MSYLSLLRPTEQMNTIDIKELPAYGCFRYPPVNWVGVILTNDMDNGIKQNFKGNHMNYKFLNVLDHGMYQKQNIKGNNGLGPIIAYAPPKTDKKGAHQPTNQSI